MSGPSIIAMAALVLVLAVPTAEAADWPMVQRDPLHSGFITSGPTPPLKRAWHASPGDPESNFTTWPVVYQGAVYARSGDGVLAVDVETGKTLWFVNPPGSKIVAPAVDEGGVYLPVPFQQILALNRETGAELWRFKADAELEAAPVLAEGRLYFGSFDGQTFYCVNVADGSLVWKFKTEYGPDSVPVVADGLVVFTTEDIGSSRVNIYALDAATGKEVWRVGQQENNSSPSILGNKVIIGGGDLFVYALDLKTGRRVWRTEVPGKFHVRTSPAIAFGDVFMADRVGNFYRLDGDTGRMKWSFDETEGTFDQSYPVIAGKTFYVGGGAGWIYALNADTGKLLWKDQVGGFVMSGAADADRFYFGVKFRNEGLYAYEHNPDPNAETGVTEDEEEGGTRLPMVIFGALVILSLVLAGVIVGLRIVTRRLSKKLP